MYDTEMEEEFEISGIALIGYMESKYNEDGTPPKKGMYRVHHNKSGIVRNPMVITAADELEAYKEAQRVYEGLKESYGTWETTNPENYLSYLKR